MSYSLRPPSQRRGFLASLFDFSFSSLIATRVVRVLYATATGLMALGTVAVIAATLSSDAATSSTKVAVVVVAPLAFLLYIVSLRIMCEVLVVFFFMAHDIERLASSGGLTTGPSSGAVSATAPITPPPPFATPPHLPVPPPAPSPSQPAPQTQRPQWW